MCKRKKKKNKQKQNRSFSESINPGYVLTNCLHEKIEEILTLPTVSTIISTGVTTLV